MLTKKYKYTNLKSFKKNYFVYLEKKKFNKFFKFILNLKKVK